MSFQLGDSSVGSTVMLETKESTSSTLMSSPNTSSEVQAALDNVGDDRQPSESQESALGIESLSSEGGNEGFFKYHVDYKPESSHKEHIYSIRELLELSKDVPEEYSAAITATLPKKSFWRLSSRHPEGNSGSNQKNNNSFRHVEPSAEKKNHRSRGSRNGRRGSKFSKGDKHYVEEKDIKVNNDDLLALEEEIKPTGNSISDFENWKTKMKELERKKKGLPPLDKNDQAERPPLEPNRSSLSDFFNLKKENGSAFEELESMDGRSDTPKGSSSRFSSFFSSASSSTPNIPQTPLAQQPNPKEVDARSASGSRVLSFLNKSEGQPINESHQQRASDEQVPVDRIENREGKPTVRDQTNNNFFQGLLNKGKSSDNIPKNIQESFQFAQQRPDTNKSVANPNVLGKSNPSRPSGSSEGPPGLSKMPQNPQRINLQSNFQMGMPPNMMPPMGQHMNMPPPGYPSFQMPPPGVRIPQHFFGDQHKQRINQDSDDVKLENNQRPPQMHPQFIPGPGNMPPPGFAPMQAPPPGISPDMQMTMNGMMPPHGFYPPQGPNFPQFGTPQMPGNGVPLQSRRMAPQRE